MGEVPPCTGKKLIKALTKEGLEIITTAGKGSHVKIKDPKTGDSTTIPHGDLSYVRESIVKWAVAHGYSKKRIISNL